MGQVSVAEAKNRLPRLIQEAERGEPVHITRNGKPAAVLISELEYAQMAKASQGGGFLEFVDAWREAMEADGIEFLGDHEFDGLRDQEGGRDFQWED